VCLPPLLHFRAAFFGKGSLHNLETERSPNHPNHSIHKSEMGFVSEDRSGNY
jgi:hypothetical protein